MHFETKYRKRALQLWEESREENKQELLAELKSLQSKLSAFLQQAQAIFSSLLDWQSNKKSHP